MPTTTIGENSADVYGGNSMDNYIRDSSPTANNGTLSTVRIRGLTGDIQRILLSFPDITSISGTVTVSASSINLYATVNSGFTITVEARKLLRNWVETESTHNIYSTGNNWTTAGAQGNGTDRNTTASSSTSVNNTVSEYKAFSGAQLNTDCENDINGSTTHYGHVLERSDGVTATLITFASQSGTDGQRPYLSVTYAAGASGWTGTINGVTNPSHVNGIAVANIDNVNGIT